MQNQPPREKSPSPSFRDRQRTIKALSVPITLPSVAQVFANQGQQPQRQDASTNSYQIQRKSPPNAQYSPPTLPRASSDLPADRPLPVPNQQAGQHSMSNPNISMAAMHPRVQRVPAPQVIRQFEEMAESEQMTAEQLLASIARAHQTSPKEARSDRPDPSQSHTPDRRSPIYHNDPSARSTLKSDSPPVPRKSQPAGNTDLRGSTERVAQVQTRTPDRDRSLPVQEEQDDPRPHDEDDSGGRSSRAGHRSDDQTLINTDPENDKGEETDGDAFTPRSSVPTHLPSDDQGRPQRSHSAEAIRPRQHEDPRWHAYHDKRVLNPTQYYEHEPPRGYTPLIHPDYLDYTDIGFLQSYLSSPRPEAPVPPTPDGHAGGPSPSPSVSGHPFAPNQLPSPVQPVGSPYPFPFSHVSRNHSYNLRQVPQAPSVDDSVRPSIIQDIKAQVAKQWNVYALNNNLEPSESAFSPSSTPGARDDRYGPWANLHMQRTLGGPHPDLRSMQSSPSHEPLPVAPPRTLGLRKARSLGKRHLPPRVESTQPRETSPEPSSSGEETAGEERYVMNEEGKWVSGNAVPPLMPVISTATDETEWVDEDDEAEDDLLQLEYHPTFVRSVEKRRRRWRMHWDAMTEAFQALDQQTDATIIVLAAPSHTNKLYSLSSRSIRREIASRPLPAFANLRSSFSQLASRRRITRSQPKASLASQLLSPSLDGRSELNGDTREEELKRALEVAIGTLGDIYEQREARWREEVKRANDEKDRVELLFKQVFGSPSASTNGVSEGESSGAGGKTKAA